MGSHRDYITRPYHILRSSNTLEPTTPNGFTDSSVNTFPALPFGHRSFIIKLCGNNAAQNQVSVWPERCWHRAATDTCESESMFITLPLFLRTQWEYDMPLKSHWVKSENSQSPRTGAPGILVFFLEATYSFETANAPHASQAAPHSAGTLVKEAITQCETSYYNTNG